MKSKLLFLIFFLSLFLVPTFAVEVVVQNPEQTNQYEGLATFILGIIGLVVIGFIGIGITFGIVYWIYKKIVDLSQKDKNFLYSLFKNTSDMCFINRDYGMIRKKKRTFFLTYKRNPIYANTSNGIKFLGLYNGEMDKKEDFYILGIYNKIGWFAFEESLILIPSKLKYIVKKEFVNGKKCILIDCEGVDSVNLTQYFQFPLLKQKDKDKFIDLTTFIHNNFIEQNTYRDIIEKQLISFRRGVILSVEANPKLQRDRREPESKEK